LFRRNTGDHIINVNDNDNYGFSSSKAMTSRSEAVTAIMTSRGLHIAPRIAALTARSSSIPLVQMGPSNRNDIVKGPRTKQEQIEYSRLLDVEKLL
jgi:hypothetical protein